MDWDDAYANMAHVPGSEHLPQRWAEEAQTFRTEIGGVEDLSYGPEARHRIHIVHPEGDSRGLVVFVHGGYWLKFAPSDWTWVARGARLRGYTVALPGYPLAPDATIADITQQVGRAVARVAGEVPGPIHLCGHSAGGHLVARLICDDTPMEPAVLDRIAAVMPISGLFDLRPLMWTAMNASFRLDEAAARSESPLLRRPMAHAPPVRVVVGGAERPEFIRQSQALATVWPGLGAHVALSVVPDADHFSIVDGLTAPDGPLLEMLLTGE